MNTLNEILEIDPENQNQNQNSDPEEKGSNTFSRVCIEMLFFVFIYLVCYSILIGQGFGNDTAVKFVLAILFGGNAIFLIIRNKKFKIVSIIYSIIISICILYILDKRQLENAHTMIFILCVCISIIFNLLIKHLTWKEAD